MLVDDDRFLQRALQKLLAGEGHFCRSAYSCEDARRALSETAPEEPYDLVILDIGLPDLDGISFCRQLRERHRMPVLLLTARSDTADRVVGLEVGADDYLTKPFEPRELVARVRALLRRAGEYSRPAARDSRIQIGPVTLDLDAREAFREEEPLRLTQREFELLHLLARHRGKALASEWIFENVWGFEADPDHPRHLLTVRGFGYKLTAGDD